MRKWYSVLNNSSLMTNTGRVVSQYEKFMVNLFELLAIDLTMVDAGLGLWKQNETKAMFALSA